MPTDDNGGELAPSPPAKKLTVEVENFRAHRSGSLYGFIDVLIPELHLRIHDCTVHANHDHTRRWIGMPGKPMIMRDGAAKRDQQGKISYAPVIEIVHRGTRAAFSARAIEALLERFPTAFDEAAA